jgi:hypothetical protein
MEIRKKNHRPQTRPHDHAAGWRVFGLSGRKFRAGYENGNRRKVTMGFLHDNVVATGVGGSMELDSGQWSALLAFLMPEPDQYGRALPEEKWKLEVMSQLFDDEQMPVTLSANQARAYADALEFYSSSIPEKEEIGDVIDTVDREIDGQWKKYAITSRKGWIETDDVELIFLEEGKQMIRDLVELCRKGPIKVDLASRAHEGPRLTPVPGRTWK